MNIAKGLLGIIALKIVSWLFVSRRRPRGIERILVFAYAGLGNFILSTPAVQALRQSFPSAHIALQTSGYFGAEQILEEGELIDEIFILKTGASWLQKIRLALWLRRQRYDVALICFDSRRFFIELEILLAGIPIRVGHTWDKIKGRDTGAFLYTHRVPLAAGRHEIDLKLDLVASLLGKPVERIAPVFVLNERHRQAARCLLEEAGLEEGKPYICVQLGAGNTIDTPKRWSVSRFAALLDRVIEGFDVPVVALGDANEVELAEQAKGMMKERLFSLVGKTSVKEAAAVIENARLLICHDSGLMHIAVALNTPVVALFGPSDYYRARPLGEIHATIRKELSCSPCMHGFQSEGVAQRCPHRACLNSIEPDEVFAVVREKLGQLIPRYR